MGVPLHSINVMDGFSPRAESDRLNLGILYSVATPAAATSVTGPGTITAGTAFTSLPTITPTGGTGSGLVTIATSLKVVSATVVAGGASGFANADTITLSNGVVLAVATNSSGVVATVTVTTAGAFLGQNPAITPNPVSQVATSGSGVGTTSFTLVYGLGSAQVVNSGSYTVTPTGSTVTGGGGSGASLGAATLGGAGNAVAVAVTTPLPAQYFVTLTPNIAGDAYIANKTNAGFSVILAPALAATTLGAAVVDALVIA